VITVELHGLALFGHHGVQEEERRRGQRFLFDLWLDLAEPARDRIEETVDYRQVAACVHEVSDGMQFRLLESLAAAVADALLERFAALTTARVRVRKPKVRLGAPVEYAAATAERSQR
jgi:dihydroneopterin aldolase